MRAMRSPQSWKDKGIKQCIRPSNSVIGQEKIGLAKVEVFKATSGNGTKQFKKKQESRVATR